MKLRHGQRHAVEINGEISVSGFCTSNGRFYSTGSMPRQGLESWLNGCAISAALPSASKEDREFLISGISPEGWIETFGKPLASLPPLGPRVEPHRAVTSTNCGTLGLGRKKARVTPQVPAMPGMTPLGLRKNTPLSKWMGGL